MIADACLVLLVLAAWIGCAAFARLGGTLDRLHCVTFVAAVPGGALAAASFLTDGISVRAFKVLALLALTLASGAALTHATGRATRLRRRVEDEA